MKATIEGITIEGTPEEMAAFFLEHETQTVGTVPPMMFEIPVKGRANAKTFDAIKKYLTETIEEKYGVKLTIADMLDPTWPTLPKPNPPAIMGHSALRPVKGCTCGACYER